MSNRKEDVYPPSALIQFVYVPYEPSDARIVAFKSEAAAVRWFKKHAGATSRTRAHLNTAAGKCIASYGDGEYSPTCEWEAWRTRLFRRWLAATEGGLHDSLAKAHSDLAKSRLANPNQTKETR